MPLLKKGEVPSPSPSPSPGPGNYVWVETKEGCYWRRKRGSLQTAKLNDAYLKGAERMRVSAPASSRVMQHLRRYSNGLDMGRLHPKISGIFRKALKEKGAIALSDLDGLSCQPRHPFEHLLQVKPVILQSDTAISVTIPIDKHTIKRMNKLVTGFYFELILLYGDITTDNGLRTESEESGVYAIGYAYEDCILQMVLPEQPWIALLKINGIEGNEMAMHPKLYGMKVVAELLMYGFKLAEEYRYSSASFYELNKTERDFLSHF
jgi:hypothetical protein